MRSIARRLALSLMLAPILMAGACASRAHQGVLPENRSSHVESYAPNAVDYSGEARNWLEVLDAR